MLDWEEAGYGHPAADVAYARMGYCIEGEPEAADEFLRVYEQAAGWTLDRGETWRCLNWPPAPAP